MLRNLLLGAGVGGAATLAVTCLAVAGPANAAGRVEIRDAAARVMVVPENRSDVKVEFITSNPALRLDVRNSGDRLVIDGGLKRRIRQCGGAHWDLHINGGRETGGNVGVTVQGVGRVAWDDLPQVVIRTPMQTKVAASGAVFGSIGRAASVALDNAGCGDWTVANVNGPLNVDIAGSGNVRTGQARQAWIRVAGSGDVATQAIAGGGDVRIAGSGDVRLASVARSLRAEIAGSGNVRVDGGRVDTMVAHIAGSGDVDFRGGAGTLDASIAGSGDVHAAAVTGQVKRTVLGSGSVYVAGQELRRQRDLDRDRDRD